MIHTQATNNIYREIRKITNSKDKNNNIIYETEYEPIEKNRDKLIIKNLPLVLQLARQTSSNYNSKIELNDCISAGMVGLIEGVDLYILRAKSQEHTAKLSSYVFPWIQKRIREYANGNLTILTTSARQLRNALDQTFVMSGNEVQQDSENGSSEFFDTSNEPNLMVEDDQTLYELDTLSRRLFEVISNEEKRLLFMNFGIGIDKPMTIPDIANSVNKTINLVERQIDNAIKKLRGRSFDGDDLDSFLKLAKNKNLSSLNIWRI